MKTLNIVGCGRVGKTLANLWHRHGVLHFQDVLTRSAATAQDAVAFIGAGRACNTVANMRPADLWMLAVPDASLAEVAQHLCDQAEETPARPIVFHCSGALDSTLLAPLQALGWHTASAHCLLSFATPQAAVAQFAGTACALEGDAVARTALEPLFTAIGAQCFALQSDQKLLYHAAAVFATNFLPVLQSVAEDLWRSTGVPPAMIPALRASLLANSVANITTLGPQKALTGPAARGDVAAIARQGAAVAAWSKDAGAAYQALSEIALEMARRQVT